MAFSGFGSGCVITGVQGDTDTRKWFVKYIRWINGAAADDICEIRDSGGNTIFKSVADGPNFTDVQPIFSWVYGLNILDVDSGTVYIYYQ